MTNPNPYYTIAGDPSATVATIGPVDPNAGTRAKLYAGLAVLTPLLGFLATFNVVTTDQGNALVGFISAAMGLLGVFGFGLAAKNTNKQVKNGTFDPAPATPVLDAFQSINAIKAHVDQTVSDATTQVNQGVAAIQAATAMIPGPIGGVASGAIGLGADALGDLLRSVGAINRQG